MRNNLYHSILVAVLFCALAGSGSAGVIYDVTLNTNVLVGHPAGPFAIEFQLNDGGGAGDGNNTAVLSNFSFGSGAATGSPILNGNASGSASTTINLSDGAFFNQFIQTFTPGSQLGFRLTLSTNVDPGGIPDQFTFAILDRTRVELPTTFPFDVLVQIDIDSANPVVHTFATDTGRTPAAGGSSILMGAPVVTVVSPEPATWLLLGVGLAGFAWRRHH